MKFFKRTDSKPSSPTVPTSYAQNYRCAQRVRICPYTQLDTIGPQLLNGPYPRPRQWPGSALRLTYDHSERHTGSHGVMVAAPPWRHCQMSANDSLLASGSATIVTRPTRHSATGAPSRRTMGGILRPIALYGRDSHHVYVCFGVENC